MNEEHCVHAALELLVDIGVAERIYEHGTGRTVYRTLFQVPGFLPEEFGVSDLVKKIRERRARIEALIIHR